MATIIAYWLQQIEYLGKQTSIHELFMKFLNAISRLKFLD